MNRLGFLFAVLAAVLFGVGGSLAQFLFTHRGFNTEWLVTMRLLCAGSLLLLVQAVRRVPVMAIWRDRKDGLSLILFGLLGMLAVQYTYFAAIHASNSATATVLQYTGPAMIAAWLSLRRRRWPDAREAAGIALAMAGTFVLVTHGQMRVLSISPSALFWGLASAVAAAFNALQPGPLLRKYGAASVTGWGMLVGGLGLCLVHPPWVVAGRWDLAAFLCTGFILLFGTLLAFYLYIKAVQLIGAQMSSLLTCAEPLTAAVLAVWWLGVTWGAKDWLGAGLILVTILLLTRAQQGAVEKVT